MCISGVYSSAPFFTAMWKKTKPKPHHQRFRLSSQVMSPFFSPPLAFSIRLILAPCPDPNQSTDQRLIQTKPIIFMIILKKQSCTCICYHRIESHHHNDMTYIWKNLRNVSHSSLRKQTLLLIVTIKTQSHSNTSSEAMKVGLHSCTQSFTKC